jgi:cytoskeleton protein RodZ
MRGTRTDTGIGRALRTARLRRGLSLEEASRDTRVRTDFLDALERESFGDLGPDVYVRSFLRSYSKYLGLNPDRVVSAYARVYGRPQPAPTPVERAPGVGLNETVVLTGGNRRANWFLAATAAVILLASAGAIGLLTRAEAPEPAPASPPADLRPQTGTVRVDLVARRSVGVRVVVDGEELALPTRLVEDEIRSFEGKERIEVELSEGDSVRVVVNGHSLGTPGLGGHKYAGTWDVASFREEESSPSAPSPDGR